MDRPQRRGFVLRHFGIRRAQSVNVHGKTANLPHTRPSSATSYRPALESATAHTKTEEDRCRSSKEASIPANRAQAIVDRLEGWLLVAHHVMEWLEEEANIHLQSSQAYYQRALVHVDWRDARCSAAMGTVLSSLRYVTVQTASAQQEAGHKIRREYLEQLKTLKKECQNRIQSLKSNRALCTDELLRRAAETQKWMAQLNKLCDVVDLTGQKQDPWLANLNVLRHLKKEVDEENRLRLLMLPIQQQTRQFEKRLVDVLKPMLEYCYEHHASRYQEDRSTGEAARIQRSIARLDPATEWARFVEQNKDTLVADEQKPQKNYLDIHYRNRLHPAVMTLMKGKLERRQGGVGRRRRLFSEKYFILSHSGFLHQFSIDDKVLPEATLHIPKTVIVPSTGISYYDDDDDGGPSEDSFTFEIRHTGALQREKTIVLRAYTRQDYLTWCRLLVDVATKQSYHNTGIQRSVSSASNLYMPPRSPISPKSGRSRQNLFQTHLPSPTSISSKGKEKMVEASAEALDDEATPVPARHDGSRGRSYESNNGHRIATYVPLLRPADELLLSDGSYPSLTEEKVTVYN